MHQLLQELRNYASRRNNLGGVEVVDRLIERINRGETTESDIPLQSLERMVSQVERGQVKGYDLLIYILHVIERYEASKISETLHRGVNRRRGLATRFETEMEKAAKRRDAVIYLNLQHDLELLKQSPTVTRQIDEETIDLAIKALRLKAQHNWSYERISTELFGDPSQADRIKKAVSRSRKAMKL